MTGSEYWKCSETQGLVSGKSGLLAPAGPVAALLLQFRSFLEPEREGGLESDSEELFQGGEKRVKRLEDLLLLRISTGLDRPEVKTAEDADAQNSDARSREPVLLAAPAL